MIAKPGYGTFAEAACNAIPVLYVSRSDWPEKPPVHARWLANRVPLKEISRPHLMAGRIAEPLAEILAAPRPVPTEPTGITEAADLIQALLPAGGHRPGYSAGHPLTPCTILRCRH